MYAIRSYYDIENTPVLPENQQGENYEHKWTTIKTHRGRTIVSSDDPNDERVEITGKKREMNFPPTGLFAGLAHIPSSSGITGIISGIQIYTLANRLGSLLLTTFAL